MNRDSTFSVPEIVGVAAVAAASLGGIIVALGRSQASASTSTASSVKEFSDAARHQLEHGRKAARSATDAVFEAYPGIRDQAVDILSHVAESAAPQASKASELAASGVQTARSTGAVVLERLQDVVIPAATDALDSLRDQSSHAMANARPATAGVAASSMALADAAVTRSTSAVRDTVATVFWLSAAISIIYYLILDESRRDKVRSFIFGAYDQSRLLIQDFQGYDEDI